MLFERLHVLTEASLFISSLVVVTNACPDKGRLFFVSRRFASRMHEISDLKKALVLSLRAGYTRLRDQNVRFNLLLESHT